MTGLKATSSEHYGSQRRSDYHPLKPRCPPTTGDSTIRIRSFRFRQMFVSNVTLECYGRRLPVLRVKLRRTGGNIQHASTLESVENRYRFHGREFNAHRGDYYIRNRIYGPALFQHDYSPGRTDRFAGQDDVVEDRPMVLTGITTGAKAEKSLLAGECEISESPRPAICAERKVSCQMVGRRPAERC